MPSTMRVERNRRNFSDVTHRYDAKREALVRCARRMGEEGDASKVSVTDITREMGITRGLFYYYFASKDELNRAIADSYVDDLVGAVRKAMDDAPEGDRTETVRAMVAAIVAWQYASDGERQPMDLALTQIGLHEHVRRGASEGLAQLLIEHGLVVDYGRGGDGQLLRRVRLVTTGLIGEVHLHGDESIDDIADAVCAALRYRHRRRPVADA